jgi:catechol 2,3-dioxygenase-like lactoylglutathione lyase family enzyme
MIASINHLTLSVPDVDRSFRFYVDTLGLKPLARWRRGRTSAPAIEPSAPPDDRGHEGPQSVAFDAAMLRPCDLVRERLPLEGLEQDIDAFLEQFAVRVLVDQRAPKLSASCVWYVR